MEINPLSVTSLANIFSHSLDCLFILFRVPFAVQKLLSLIRSHLVIFVFIFITLEVSSCKKKKKKNPNNPIKKWAEDLNMHLLKKTYKWTKTKKKNKK